MDHKEWQRLLEGVRDGDSQVMQEFWQHYGPLLHKVAERHLGGAVQRRVGPEDVVQSACRTFLRRVKGGQFELQDSEGLWRLLCAITLNKLRQQVRFHRRQKRGLEKEQPLQATDADDADIELRAPEPTPDQAAAFADQFEQLLTDMDEEERSVVDLKLQEYTHDEVASKMGISERTVRRIVKRIQRRLSRMLKEDD